MRCHRHRFADLGTATQTFQTFAFIDPIPTPAECFPDLQVTELIFTAGNGTVPDSLTINWNKTGATNDCLAGGILFTSYRGGTSRESHAVFGEFREKNLGTPTQDGAVGTSNSPWRPTSSCRCEQSVSIRDQAIKKTDF